MGKNKYLENLKTGDCLWQGNEYGEIKECTVTEDAVPSTLVDFTNIWLKHAIHHPRITTWQEMHLTCEAKQSYTEYVISHVKTVFATSKAEVEKRIKILKNGTKEIREKSGEV